MKNIYFDNSATSYPKPKQVIEAVVNYMENIGANPGRGSHKTSFEGGRIIYKTRKLLAKMYDINNPMGVIFCPNGTFALNLVIKGYLRENDHVITSSMDHNSVLRPVINSRDYTIVQGNKLGIVDPLEIEKSIKENTKLIVITHGSNVNGAINDIKSIGSIAKKRGITLLVDSSQTAGILPFSLGENNVDLVAFTGHKGLYGPTGTGGLIIGDNFDYKKIKPLCLGGTGSLSDKPLQPDFLPDIFESGTLNTSGIAGLHAGIEFINNYPEGFKGIRKHKYDLTNYFIEKAKDILGIKLFSEPNSLGVVSFIFNTISVSDLSDELNNKNILCRQGLHCAPLAHKTLGTYPDGTIRFSFGLFNTKKEIDIAIEELKDIVNG